MQKSNHSHPFLLDALSSEQRAKLEECQALIKYHFKDLGFLLRALTHSSSANHKLLSNERLEFLGDSIMGACICEFLFHRFPSLMEGELTKIKSIVVSGDTCAKTSQRMGLDDFIIVGKGMANSSTPPSLLADLFESIVAAIFLDGGWEAAKTFVLEHMRRQVEKAVETNHESNFKSQLQHLVQKELGIAPTYELLNETGPDHKKSFLVAIKLGEQVFTAAWGKNKKQAEQRAASNALAEMQNETAPFADTQPEFDN